MKYFKYLVIGASLALASSAFGQYLDPVGSSGFGIGTTNGATALSWAIVPAHSVNGGAPRVTYIHASSDVVTGKIQFYKVVGGPTLVTATNSTVTITVERTNGVYAASGVIIIRHTAQETYEKRTLTTPTGTNTLVVTAAPYTTVPGDLIYLASTTGAGTIQWGVNTNGIGPGTIYVGQRQKPLLVEISGTTSATLDVVGGDYLP
jgi:hypothetical protein